MEDTLYKYRKYLNKLPKGIISFAGSLYGLIPERMRYGKEYVYQVRFLNKSQYWNEQQMLNYQNECLQSLITHAYENVPFYRAQFQSIGIHPDDIVSVDDLKKIPITDKKTVRDNLKSFLAKNFSSSVYIPVHTGGSTGVPLSLYYQKGRTWPRERAFMDRQFKWVGYHYAHDRTVILRGNVPKNGWFEYDPTRKALILSSYLLTRSNATSYLEKIKQYQPVSIQAYPSVIALLSSYLQDTKSFRIPSLKVILCGSEKINPNQRELIEQVFGCRTYSWYGQSECVCLAGECELNKVYHIYPEYGLTEVLDENGSEVSQPGQIGEIVATGFNNYLMPLIRYRTGDLAVKSDAKCKCGRPYPLLKKIEGRTQEIIFTKDGEQIALNPIVFGIHGEIWRNIHAVQFIQNTPGDLVVCVVKSSNIPAQKLIYSLRECLNERSGNRFKFNISFVDQLQRNKNGKAPFLIQNLIYNL
jgi:phenylacetate-CoA ligase